MTPRVLIYLLSSAAAWFASSTDDDLRTWLGDHEPYAAQTEAQARACGATCRASLRQGYRCEGIERPLPPCEFERKPVNADFASLLRATTTPKASCAGPHGAVACYTFGVRAQRPGRARRWRAVEHFREGVTPRRAATSASCAMPTRRTRHPPSAPRGRCAASSSGINTRRSAGAAPGPSTANRPARRRPRSYSGGSGAGPRSRCGPRSS